MKKRSLLIVLLVSVLALGLAACKENNPTALSVAKDPAKMEYTIGEALDLSGGELKVTYKDGTSSVVGMTDEKVKAEGFDSTSAGQKAVTLTFEGLTARLTVSVEAKITAIELLKEPTATDYFEGESLNLAGGQLKVIYNDGTDKTVSMTAAGVTAEGYDSAVLGKQTVTVKYSGFETTFDVNVRAAAKSIEVESAPQTVDYKPGSQLDLTGGKIKVTYTDDTYDTIDMTSTGVSVTGFDAASPGEQTITVKYMGKETQFTVKVLAVASLVISEDPSKEEYSIGQTLNLSGGMLEVTYEDTSTDIISMTAAGVTTEGFSSDAPGMSTVTVKYYGQSATFAVNIVLGEMLENAIEQLDNCEWSITNIEDLSGSNAWDQNPNDLFFEMYFFRMSDAVNEILDSGNDAVIAYYESELEARCNALLNEFNEYYFVSAVHNDLEYRAFIDELLSLYYKHYKEPEYTIGDEAFDAEFRRLWKEFLGLSGAAQDYIRMTWNDRAFHILSREFYDEHDMWNKLFDVWGFYVYYLNGMNPTDNFFSNMVTLNTYYEGLTGEAKAFVDKEFGFEYAIYLDAYNSFTEVPEEIWDINEKFQVVYESYVNSAEADDFTFYIVAYNQFVAEMKGVLESSSERVVEYYNNFPIGGNTLAKWYSNLGDIYDEAVGPLKNTSFFNKYIEVSTKSFTRDDYAGGNAEFDADCAEMFALFESLDDLDQLRFFVLCETAYSTMIDSYYSNLFKNDYEAYQTYVRLHYAWTFDLMTRSGMDLLVDVLLSTREAMIMYEQIEDKTLFDATCSVRYNKYVKKYNDENFINPALFDVIDNMIYTNEMEYLSQNLKDYTYFLISYYKLLDSVEKLYDTRDAVSIEIYEDRYLFTYSGANMLDSVDDFVTSYLRAISPYHEPNSDEEVSPADVETYAAFVNKYLLSAENYIYDESYVVGESNVDAAITGLIEEFRGLKPLMQIRFKNSFGVYEVMVKDYHKYYLDDESYRVYSYLYSAVFYYSFYMADSMESEEFVNFMSRAVIAYNDLADKTEFNKIAGAEYDFYLAEFNRLRQYTDRIHYIMLYIGSEMSEHNKINRGDFAIFLYHYESLTKIINAMLADNIAEELAMYETVEIEDPYEVKLTLKGWYEYYSGPECYGKLQDLISTHITSTAVFEEFFTLFKKIAFDYHFHPEDFHMTAKEDMARLTALFRQLTLSEQRNFDDLIASETYIQILGEFYSWINGRLTLEEYNVYASLSYASQNFFWDNTEGFMRNMGEAIEKYEALEDKTNFDAHLSEFFGFYKAIYESLLEEEPEDPEASEAVIFFADADPKDLAAA